MHILPGAGLFLRVKSFSAAPRLFQWTENHFTRRERFNVADKNKT